MEKIKKKLIEIAESISGTKIENINLDGKINEQIHLDSMQLITLFSKIESEFDIDLPLEAMNSKTVNEFLGFVENEMNN